MKNRLRKSIKITKLIIAMRFMNKFKNKLETYAVIMQTLENVCVRNCSPL